MNCCPITNLPCGRKQNKRSEGACRWAFVYSWADMDAHSVGPVLLNRYGTSTTATEPEIPVIHDEAMQIVEEQRQQQGIGTTTP